jgi:hypothetical protein
MLHDNFRLSLAPCVFYRFYMLSYHACWCVVSVRYKYIKTLVRSWKGPITGISRPKFGVFSSTSSRYTPANRGAAVSASSTVIQEIVRAPTQVSVIRTSGAKHHQFRYQSKFFHRSCQHSSRSLFYMLTSRICWSRLIGACIDEDKFVACCDVDGADVENVIDDEFYQPFFIHALTTSVRKCASV